jgi:hypothetical protein
MGESVFAKNIKSREVDQEIIKASNNLEAKQIYDQIHLSIPAEHKERFLKYCQEHYVKPSFQLRTWIEKYCK